MILFFLCTRLKPFVHLLLRRTLVPQTPEGALQSLYLYSPLGDEGFISTSVRRNEVK